MFGRSYYFLLPLVVSSQSDLSKHTPSNCKDIVLSVSATADNWDLPPYPNATDVATLGRYLGQILPSSNFSSKPKVRASGDYNISARYCEPINHVVERVDTVQLLLHGFMSDKLYWHGSDYPNATFDGQYSWAHHAASQGYSTLSIDNLGNGDSDHPDPITTVQFPLQSQIILNIISGLRTCTLTPEISQKFSKVVMASHSYGSLHARELSISHPTTGADAYILTATAWNPLGLTAIVSAVTAGSASAVDPRLEHLPSAYMSAKLSAWETYLYSGEGDFDPAFVEFEKSEFSHTFTVGELASPKQNITSEFEGPVMVITGRNDVLVCTTAGSGVTGRDVDCGVGDQSIPAQLAEAYPRAKFGAYVPDSMGHNVNTGYASTQAFGATHMFLESNGF